MKLEHQMSRSIWFPIKALYVRETFITGFKASDDNLDKMDEAVAFYQGLHNLVCYD